MADDGKADGYLLIHGGCHGSWCWDSIVPKLDRPALAIDLPGRDGDPSAFRTITLSDWVRSAEEQLMSFGPRRVVLVAHSLGGVTAAALAQTSAERIHAIVFVSCILPADGQSAAEAIAGDQYEALFRDDGGFWPPPAAHAKEILMNDVPDEIADPIVARLVPEPSPPFVTPVSYRRVPSVATTYVALTKDRGLPPNRQEQMIANFEIDDVARMDTCHNAMVSEPSRLAELIRRAAG
jgi:pimeloyl-ACP methyl ester carboxylesterase